MSIPTTGGTHHTVPETGRIDDDSQFTIDTNSEKSRELTLDNDNNNQISTGVVSIVTDLLIPSRKK